MKYKVKEDIYAKKIDGGWFILDKDKKSIRELNDTAGLIWGLLRKPSSLDEAVKSVCDTFKVDRAIAKRDTQKFINEYVREGYIEVVSDR